MNYRLILHTLGVVLTFEAIFMLLPLLCGVFYGEKEVITFAICIVICYLAGLGLKMIKPKNKSIYVKEGFVIVALSWIIMSIFGTFPFVISGCIPNYIDALFETVSGFTTTGASILSDVESLPKSILFWRSFTHWIGGMGVLVFLVAILPLSGGSNLNLMKAESTGPSVSKLVPRVKSTAKILYTIYSAMTILEIILLLIGKLNLFEAITLSFGTAGTGGFGTRNDSIAGYSSYVQIVITIFMILFGINFSLYYLLLIKKVKDVFKSEELKVYLSVIIIAAALICINSYNHFAGFFDAVKHSLFQVASIITTTGYSTADFNLWPEFSKTTIVGLMFLGACAGSTGGGIKVSRILVLFKSIIKELKIIAHPNSTHKITVDSHVIEHETIRSINVYIMAYIAIFVSSILIISFDNFNFTTNFTAVASAINNIGPGLDGVGPTSNFSGYSNLSTLVLTFNMLVGRLEVFPVLMLFSPYTWRK